MISVRKEDKIMLKVLAACGNGMGSSQLIKMRIESVLKELNQDYSIDHSSVGIGKSMANNYDLVIVPLQLVNEFSGSKATIIGLKNLLSTDEMREKIKAALNI